MQRLPSLRASDSDREHVAERLRHATAEGRLSASELEERLEALFAARTYGELDALLADLPASRSPATQVGRLAPWAGAVGALTLMLAALGMLAVTRVHTASVAGHGHERFRFPGPLAGPHQGLIVAGSMVAAFVVSLVCVAFVWALMRSTAGRMNGPTSRLN